MPRVEKIPNSRFFFDSFSIDLRLDMLNLTACCFIFIFHDAPGLTGGICKLEILDQIVLPAIGFEMNHWLKDIGFDKQSVTPLSKISQITLNELIVSV